MSKYLSPKTQLAVKAALSNIADTFFTKIVTLNHRTTVLDPYGENPSVSEQTATIRCLADNSVGKSGRYQDIDKTDMGQRDQMSWHLLFWHEDIIALPFVVDSEADSVSFDKIEYEIRLFTPGALFADLGFLLDDMELKLTSGGTNPGTPALGTVR